jgi:hypothetical protein
MMKSKSLNRHSKRGKRLSDHQLTAWAILISSDKAKGAAQASLAIRSPNSSKEWDQVTVP